METLETRDNPTTLYGALGGSALTSNLFTLNPNLGSIDQTIGPIGFPVSGLAFDQQTGILYGVTRNSPSTPSVPFNFIQINTQTGAGTVINSLPILVDDITYDPTTGNIYGWMEGVDDLIVIDKSTGVVTIVGNSGLTTSNAGLAADASGTLYLIGEGSTGPLRTVNKTTGATTVVANLSGNPIQPGIVPALSFNPQTGTLWGVNANNDFATTFLVQINQATGFSSLTCSTQSELDAIAWDYSANLSGTVFLDSNGDGIQQPTEPGVGNVTVNLDLGNNGSIDRTTLTNAAGQYIFVNAPSGTNAISLTVPSGLTQTFPVNNGFYATPMTGVDTAGFNFGVRSGAPPVVPSALLGVGAGPGEAPRVQVYNVATSQLLRDFLAYDPAFTGGVNVALGDVTGDGVQDIITAPASNGGSDVRVFDGVTGVLLKSFLAYPGFTGGVNVAVGDIDNDGIGDIITGPASGGGTHVRVFRGGDYVAIRDFLAFDARCRGGVSVASGNIDGIGGDDIVAGLGSPGALVTVFNGSDLSVIQTFFAFDPNSDASTKVAVGNFDGDNLGDVYVTQGRQGSLARVFRVRDGALLAETSPYPGFNGGASVTTVDANNDGLSELVTGSGPEGGPNVRIFSGPNLTMIDSFLAFSSNSGGANVGG